jgi:Cytochrome c554 and c-prime
MRCSDKLRSMAVVVRCTCWMLAAAGSSLTPAAFAAAAAGAAPAPAVPAAHVAQATAPPEAPAAPADQQPAASPPPAGPAIPPAHAPTAAAPEAPATPAASGQAAADAHAAVFASDPYPSAAVCATCHQAQYEEWRYSNHAYASISPMFSKFEQRINDLSQGTVGEFCMRCHASVETAQGKSRDLPLWKRSRIAREGVTCITCHRVNESYGKVNAERRIVPGDIFQPVYGSLPGDGVKEIVDNPKAWNAALAPGEFGLQMHREGIQFKQIAQSEFCVSCHQVAVHPGIKLETVWDEYRASPALRENIQCQDCHMSTQPGLNSGYATGPAAVINGRTVNANRRRSNHAFIGPGYSISHPGIFPHHPESDKFPVEAWMSFDYRAAWGSDAFEDKVAKGQVKVSFPAAWASADDRAEAWLIVQDNLKKLDEKRELRRQLMENSSHLDGPYFSGEPRTGKALHFHYRVSNLNNGHNMPSGSLGAQPEIWLNVALIDPDGRNVWESGYLDHNGDMADLHSLDVAAGTIKHDDQLFNLQSKFLTTNLKGTDREMYLPVPFDGDQLPFIRPSGIPTSVLNHPPFIRMEKRSLPPLGSRDASFSVPAALLKKPGTYRLAVRLRSRAEPIYFMKFVGATVDMEQAMNEWMLDIHPYTVAFEVH